MGKKKKSNIKLKKLIQKRLKDVQSEPSYQKAVKPTKLATFKKISKSEKKIKTDKQQATQIKPDFKRIGFTVATLVIILIIIFIIDLKNPFLNTLADKLLGLFQKS